MVRTYESYFTMDVYHSHSTNNVGIEGIDNMMVLLSLMCLFSDSNNNLCNSMSIISYTPHHATGAIDIVGYRISMTWAY